MKLGANVCIMNLSAMRILICNFRNFLKFLAFKIRRPNSLLEFSNQSGEVKCLQ